MGGQKVTTVTELETLDGRSTGTPGKSNPTSIKKKHEDSRAQDKLQSDGLNFFFKSLALVVNPAGAIVLFSLSLYFSWQHNQSHLKKTKDAPVGETEAERKHRENKRRIILTRMYSDAFGLLLAIIVLAAQLIAATAGLKSVLDALLLVAAAAMTLSSITSTAHKIYRFRKPGYEGLTIYDGWRALGGAAGTVLLAGILFGFIPKAIITGAYNIGGVSFPYLMVGAAVLIVILAAHKGYKLYYERRAHAERLAQLDDVDETSLASLISDEQLEILMTLKKDGAYNFDALLDVRLKQISDLIKPETELSKDESVRVRNFFEQLDVDQSRQNTIAHEPIVVSDAPLVVSDAPLTAEQLCGVNELLGIFPGQRQTTPITPMPSAQTVAKPETLYRKSKASRATDAAKFEQRGGIWFQTEDSLPPVQVIKSSASKTTANQEKKSKFFMTH